MEEYYKIYVPFMKMHQFMQVLGYHQIEGIQLGANSDKNEYDGFEIIEVNLNKIESKNLINKIFDNTDKDEYKFEDDNIERFEKVYQCMFL